MAKKHMTIPIFIPHAGCPHTCVFCNQKHISNTDSAPEPSAIRNIIDTNISSKPASIETIELAFFGGSFTALKLDLQNKYLSEASKAIEEGVIDQIRLSTRPDYISDDIVENLKKFNVTTVELGVQSFDQNVLDLSQRGHSVEHIYLAHNLLKENSLKTGIQLMPGLPGDTFEKSIYSTNCTVELNPDCVRIYPTIVIKNTKLEKMYNQNKFRPLSFERAIRLTADMKTLFQKARINVIRTGLHPLDNSNTKNIISGPYHPSFGYFVNSELKFRLLDEIFSESNFNDKSECFLNIPYEKAEEYIGDKRENIIRIKEKYNCKIFYRINKKTNKPQLVNKNTFFELKKQYYTI